MRLAAGLCPDPLGKLMRSPRPSSLNKGGLHLRSKEGEEREGKVHRRGNMRGKGGKRERRGKEAR